MKIRGTEQINLLELGIRSKIEGLATALLAETLFSVLSAYELHAYFLEEQETVQSVTEKRIKQQFFYSEKSAI